MNDNQKMTLFLVDDDALFLKSLEIDFIQQSDFEVVTFSTGESCMKHIFQNPAIIILDYYLDGIEKEAMNGMKTLDQIKKYDHKIPVIILSSQDKIEVAVDCMHHGASDYVVKSETSFLRLKSIIDRIFKYQNIQKQLGWYMERM